MVSEKDHKNHNKFLTNFVCSSYFLFVFCFLDEIKHNIEDLVTVITEEEIETTLELEKIDECENTEYFQNQDDNQ